ncbi:hypothetical protein COU57_04830 [Candidatus Pacearchaeota archaeon CG10_big_fil_rev_8_21_14_0_10_32_14]|nr:MAG: hypothetical protein COU57_04830 [Candidatus Pacearchaeota archaeon CG10_big_fil_rev_8_21_14_0_10_32_14]
MKKSVLNVSLILLVVFLVGVVSAEVPITVKTIPDHDVTITVYQGDSSEVFDIYKTNTSNSDTITYQYAGSASTLRVIVFVSIFGKKVTSKVFKDLSTSSDINLEVFPDNYVPTEVVSNSTTDTNSSIIIVSNNTELTIEDNDTVVVDPSVVIDDSQKPNNDINLEKVGGTGLITGQNKSSFLMSNMTYYIIGGVLLLAIAIFLISKRVSKRKSVYDDYEPPQSQIKVRKLSDIQKETKNTGSIKKEIEDAEMRLRKAQEQLNIVKNQDRIKEAEDRLERDRRELDNLRSGRR